jgi:hypothetical protein
MTPADDVAATLDAISCDSWRAVTPAPEPDLLLLTERELLDVALSEARAYRELALAAVGTNHDLHRQLDRERAAHAALRDEYRSMRVRVLSDSGVRAS